jgi:ABC-2 type transport system permease protein
VLPELTLMDLRLRRRSMLWYAVGMAVYAFIVVAMYPSMKNDTALSNLTQSNKTAAALFGVTGSLTSPVGWTNGNLYANFLPLLVLLLTVGYGANAIAGQSEEGILGVLVALPLSRRRLVLEKAAALVVIALPMALATMAVILIGPHYQLHLGVSSPGFGGDCGRSRMAGDSLAVPSRPPPGPVTPATSRFAVRLRPDVR